MTVITNKESKIVIDEENIASTEELLKANEVLNGEITLSDEEEPKKERVYKINSAMKDGVQYIGKSVLIPLSDREHCFEAIIKEQKYIVTKRKSRGYLIIS